MPDDARTPVACPWCGQEQVFDGQGRFERVVGRVRAGVSSTITQSWTRIHCPDCNRVFAMLDNSEKEVDDD